MDIRSIEVRFASPAIERRVRTWFEKPSRAGAALGGRSVMLPHPEKRGFGLKIKGAGHQAGPIKFGVHPTTGPAAPRYDFDGRLMIDIASGHDNAYVGGASFQQAATEYAMAARLAAVGVPTVPCVGYGRVTTDTHVSWFSIHDWPLDYLDVSATDMENYRRTNLLVGETILQLAQDHGLIGYFWRAQNSKGDQLAFDLHPFVSVDPINASQLTWVMHMAFVYLVRCRACEVFPQLAGARDIPHDIMAYPLRAILPDATPEDYADLRYKLVRPVKNMPEQEFSSRKLTEMLECIRVGRALLDLCPERFTRF